MNRFERILYEIDKGINTIKPLMQGDTRIIAESQIIGLEEAKKIVEKYKDDDGWIPANEPPKDDEYVLLSFANYSLPLVGRYEERKDGGMYYIGNCYGKDTCIANNLIVNAWMPLPEPYHSESEE